MKTSVLVVEDDGALNQMLVMALRKAGYDMSSARSWAEARQQLELHAPDVVLLDMNLPDAEGFGPLSEIAAERPTIMLTAYGSIDHAVQAMRMGAADYVVKPASLDELEIVIRRAVDAGRLRAGRAVDQAASSVRRTPDLLGQSPAMKSLNQLIEAVGGSVSTVLVTGESGTGKELVANAIHKAGPRSTERFVPVDCCTLQESLFESELFGHERGAFTGADRRKSGLIEAAAGGTLFLDEIGDIGPALQAKLLRVLETGRFRRVGATADLRADVRVIAATNRKLPDMVETGSFRADLYYRLSALTIEVPPLRERVEDIPLLVQHFASRATRHGEPLQFSKAAIQQLCTHAWPGNVRELRNVVERLVLLVPPGQPIEPWHLPAFRAPASAPQARSGVDSLLQDEPTLEELESRYLALLLQRHGGNRRRVADALGISERTAYRMIDRFQLR
jgi:two-component system NtrC family response regulator